MALQGSLEDFSLAEILQLIALQRKSGVLRLTSPETGAIMFFEKGDIVSMTDRRQKKTDPLLEYLISTGKLTREQGEQIRAICEQSKKEFSEVIITGGYMTNKQLAESVESHAREVLPKLLSWEKGVYNFSGDEKTVSRLFFKVPMRTEALLMESMRRIDESDRIKQLYSPAAVLRRREPPEKPELAEEEKWVLGLIDGERPIHDILTKSRLGEFETYEILSDLIQVGVAEVAQWSSEGEPAKAEPVQSVRKARAFVPVLTTIIILAMIVGASFIIRWGINAVGDSPIVASSAATVRKGLGQEENLRFALETYNAKHGSYPDALDQLVEEGLAGEEDIRGFGYTKARSRFTLDRVPEAQGEESP